MEFRKLRADEISVRIGTKQNNNFTLLLYKDARCDMNILDETVSQYNWQRKHYMLGDDIYCSVGIFDPIGKCWVWKDDCGSAGNFEQEKSKSSDAFKRACFNWGIGRELYTSPTIRVKQSADDFYKFRVARIDYNENGEICELVIEGMDKSFKWVQLFALNGNKKSYAKPVVKETVSDDVKLAALKYTTARGNEYGSLHRDQLMQIINHIGSSAEDKKNAKIVLTILDEQTEEHDFLTLETADAIGYGDEEGLPWE